MLQKEVTMGTKKQEDIQKFINPTYRNEISLPHCQWDLRDLFNPMEREKAKKVKEVWELWETLTSFAQSRKLNSISLGLVIMEEQASLSRFKPSEDWFTGEYIFGKEIKRIYCNPRSVEPCNKST